MIYPTKPYYVISGLVPPAEYCMGGYGFHIGLQASFAKRCIKFVNKVEHIDNLNESAKKVVMKMFRSTNARPPFNFMESEKGKYTMMLGFVQVDGNACDIGTAGISCEDILKMKDSQMVEFHPHNVDSMTQAYMLLSLWLKWYSVAFSMVMDKSEI